MEKIFETVINYRLVFLNEAFDEINRHNGGFLHGSRTSDNVFVLNGLIERRMALGKPLLSGLFRWLLEGVWYHQPEHTILQTIK